MRSVTQWEGSCGDSIEDRATAEGALVSDGLQRNSEQIWRMMKKCCDLCYPMCCRINPSLSASSGLEPNRGYSLISAREVHLKGRALRMVFLRNPFGVGEWEGRWSDKSEA